MVMVTVLTPATSSSNVMKILPVNQDAGMLSRCQPIYSFLLDLYFIPSSDMTTNLLLIVRKQDIVDSVLTIAPLMFVSLDVIRRLNAILVLDRNGQRSPSVPLTCAALNLLVEPIN